MPAIAGMARSYREAHSAIACRENQSRHLSPEGYIHPESPIDSVTANKNKVGVRGDGERSGFRYRIP